MSHFKEQISKQGAVASVHTLAVVLGDQLDREAAMIDDLDAARDAILMVEAAREAEHVASHRQRTTLFLAAMRHFAIDMVGRGLPVRYITLDDPDNSHVLGDELSRAVKALSPERVVITLPGEHRVWRELREACATSGVALEEYGDESFTCSLEEFESWAAGRKSWVMEYFYRERRRKLQILVEKGKPVGDRWNFDADNREAFKTAPDVPKPYMPRPDAVTREVIELVNRWFPGAPGKIDKFHWPVTPKQARRALDDFVSRRLTGFGTYEDAMWAGEATLYHSRLASSLNVKILSPRTCVNAVVQAYERGDADLNDVEAFIRQIIGWREFVRGVYYHEGADYAHRNVLEHDGNLPAFFWTGDTNMACLRHCIGHVVDEAWGHHIPRLMVIGNFALIAGVDPRAVHEWFLGMYVDAVEWVTAPNVIGMSQHADGGVVGTKPYAGSGKYIKRMSNYCRECDFDPSKRAGETACPFNVFYWDFLFRHRKRFEKNQRMAMSIRNADRVDQSERRAIRKRARQVRTELGI